MNKMKIGLVFFLLLLSLNAQEKITNGIKFENVSWSEILSKAEAENKLIFLDAYAEWCGPCKWMSKNVFTNDTIGEYFNSNFINAKIDMEKGEGINIAKKYGVKNYPTLLYINSKGELIHRTCGSVPVSEFLQQGKDANNPETQLASVKKKFELSPSNSVIANRYFKMMNDGCMRFDDELTKYFRNQKESDLISRINWDLIKNYLADYKSREFRYLIKNKLKFSALYTPDSVEQKIISVYSNELRTQIRGKDEKEFSNLKAEIKKSKIKDSERIILNADLLWYQKTKNWKKYTAAAEKLISKYEGENFALLNSIAWTYYENIDDKKSLLMAEKWAKQSIDISNRYFNNDTYAAVLYKLGKIPEAIAAAEKAIELAKNEGADYKDTQDLLNKIKGI